MFGPGGILKTSIVSIFTLYRDGYVLEESSVNLTLTSLEVSNMGRYSCAGVNEQGQGYPDSFDLVVNGMVCLKTTLILL